MFIESAKQFKRNAFEQLYLDNRNNILTLLNILLNDSKESEKLTYQIFKNAFKDISKLPINTDEEFSDLLKKKTLEASKRSLTKNNPKAFKIPQNHNFNLSKDTKKANNNNEVLKQLPALQRFIFVLHAILGMNEEEVAETLNLDKKSISMAIEAEESNIEQLCPESTYEAVVKELKEQTYTSSKELDNQIKSVIDEICSPVEKAKRKKIQIISAIVLAILLVIGGIAYFVTRPEKEEETIEVNGDNKPSSDFDEEGKLIDYEEEQKDTSTITSSLMEFDKDTTYTAVIEIQDYGTVRVELEPHSAPISVSNFIKLAEDGFYDGLTFHRIMPGTLIQGGDPYGNGTGGSDRPIKGEFTDNGVNNTLHHTRGAVAMARAGAYDSGSCQFYFCLSDLSDQLDGKYAVFGYVTEGMEVLDAISNGASPTNSVGSIDTEAQPIITSIAIEYKQ